jgi:hypothetical protein
MKAPRRVVGPRAWSKDDRHLWDIGIDRHALSDLESKANSSLVP